MKIGVLFDGMSALGANPDTLILESVESIENSIADWGHEHVRIPVNHDGRWVERVRRGKFDLVFNLCEGIDGVAAFEPMVISVLELFGVPFTGNSSATTALCLRKNVVNTVLDRAGLPVPRWSLARKGERVTSVGFPAICKPAAEDASIGIEQRSVVRSGRALDDRIEAMHERWDEVLIQRYIAGREVNVGIVDEEVLPIAEINLGDMPRGMWKIVSYQSKWIPGSEEDLGALPSCPADLPPELSRELRRIATAAWRTVGGQGYGRVDMRIDSQGRPWLLEVNPNPDIAAGAGLARMAGVAGMDYSALVRRVCDAALTHRSEDFTEQWRQALHLSGDEMTRIFVGDLSSRYREKVRDILVATGVFRNEEIDVAIELFDSVFGARPGANAAHSGFPIDPPATSDYFFLGAFTPEEEMAGFACYGPTPGADRTYDLYWIAVHPATQGSGSGTILLNEVERRLKGLNARMVVVETSSRSEYKLTRRFYLRRGYVEAAKVRDFYAPADDRITFTKRLQSRAPIFEWMAHGVVSQ